MSTAIVSAQPQIVVAGVDTHSIDHNVTVLGIDGRWLGYRVFPATSVGYRSMVDWVATHGVIDRFGIELTGSYGAGVTRFLTRLGIEVLDIDTPHRQVRSKIGKDDRIDSEQAARKVLSGEATTIPKDTTGIVEALRCLKVARDSAVKARTVALQNIRDLLVTAPDQIRESATSLKTLHAKATHFAACRPDKDQLATPEHAVKQALRALGKRVLDLDAEIKTADRDMAALAKVAAPTLLSLPQIGTQHATQLLITAGSIPGRIHSSAAFARICGIAPVPASSGKTNRMRLHRGGDRQANKAIHMIVIGRLANHPETRAYLTRRTAEGKSKPDIIRCLKRFVAREIYTALKTDQKTT